MKLVEICDLEQSMIEPLKGGLEGVPRGFVRASCWLRFSLTRVRGGAKMSEGRALMPFDCLKQHERSRAKTPFREGGPPQLR